MRPRLLDLFCCAGGCSVGYRAAGFDVVGVDMNQRPDYPFEFICSDALEVLNDQSLLAEFDAIHASPPCQAYTSMSNRQRGDWPDLIDPVRSLLVDSGLPWVIENVVGASDHMPGALLLRGGMFGLGVDRPRLFESNVFLMSPPPAQAKATVGVYGARPDGRRLWTRIDGSSYRAASSIEEAQTAMGIDWMTDFRDLAEAIPPAYTEFLGEQLLAALREGAAAI